VEGRPSSSRRRRSMPLIAVAIVLGVPSGCAAAQAGTPTPGPSSPGAPATTSGLAHDGGIDPGTKFSPRFVSTLAAPAAVKTSDGKVHLAYELMQPRPMAETSRPLVPRTRLFIVDLLLSGEGVRVHAAGMRLLACRAGRACPVSRDAVQDQAGRRRHSDGTARPDEDEHERGQRGDPRGAVISKAVRPTTI
jgi:hypothetical protein